MNQDNGKVLSKNILNKIVVSKNGKKFGEVGDLIFDVNTGEIIDFTIIRPTNVIKDLNLERDSNGDYLAPFHAVIAVGDFLVVSEDDMI